MLGWALRRIMVAVPTLLVIAALIFLLLDLAPGDPMAQIPMTVPDDVKAEMRRALGLGQPVHQRFGLWLWQFFVVEPLVWCDASFGSDLSAGHARVISWQSRGPVVDLIADRLPQTLWVVGLAYLIGVLAALPIGLYSAYRQYGLFDHVATFATMLAFSVPPFFSGVVLIVVFSSGLGWFPSVYDTTHRVSDLASLVTQARQMVLPVLVVSLVTTAQISCYLRAAVLDNLGRDYVRMARAKGLSEWSVICVHVLRNSLIPLVSVVALGLPQVFGGAIITEQIFRVNGIGQLLITSLHANDLPTVQTITFLIAVLIVFSNLLADLLYRLLEPRLRHD